MRLLFGQDQTVADWVRRHIPHMATDFGPASAIGVMSDTGEPMAGVVFHDYQPAYGTIQLSAAAISPRWATSRIVGRMLRYPFIELGVHKVWTATEQKNKRALKFNKGVGFTPEGILRHHFGRKNHAVICGMLDTEYRERYGVLNG